MIVNLPSNKKFMKYSFRLQFNDESLNQDQCYSLFQRDFLLSSSLGLNKQFRLKSLNLEEYLIEEFLNMLDEDE